MSKKILTNLKLWIPLAFIIIIFSGTIYLTVQQNMRQGANDPQIQMAEDVANSLSTGAKVMDYNSETKIDISKSLSPFVIVYDIKGNSIASTGNLNGQDPKLPSGVFDFVKANGEDRITWQPQDGVRIAAVVNSFSSASQSGYVLAGRNLREVEKRESNLNLQVAAGSIIAVVGSYITIFILSTLL